MRFSEAKINEAGKRLCHLVEIEPTPTNVEHAKLLVQALMKFDERNAEYKDLWKEGGTSDSLHHQRSKLSRMEQVAKNVASRTFADSGIDLINYTVFAIRNQRAGR